MGRQIIFMAKLFFMSMRSDIWHLAYSEGPLKQERKPTATSCTLSDKPQGIFYKHNPTE